MTGAPKSLPAGTGGAMTTGMTDTPPRPRFLVFFARETSSEVLDERLSAIRAAASKAVELIDSLAWYEARFAACGNWDSWSLEAVTGRSYRHRQPYFDGFVSAGSMAIGRGEARTLSLALSIGKPVYWLDAGKLKRVKEVSPSSDGWHILTGGTDDE